MSTFLHDADLLRVVKALRRRTDLPPLYCDRGTLAIAWPSPYFDRCRLTQPQAERLAAGLPIAEALQPAPKQRPPKPKPKPQPKRAAAWRSRRAAMQQSIRHAAHGD